VLAKEEAATIFARQLATPTLTLLIVEAADAVVATCMLVIVLNFSSGGRPWALIENVITDEACRSRGIGRKLIDAALTQAWESGCYKAALLAGSKNEARLRFYHAAASDPTLRPRSRSDGARDAVTPDQQSIPGRSAERMTSRGCRRAPL